MASEIDVGVFEWIHLCLDKDARKFYIFPGSEIIVRRGVKLMTHVVRRPDTDLTKHS